jgi:hypothetical protein
MTRDPKDSGAEPGDEHKGLSRRGFLTSVGTGALSAVAANHVKAEPAPSTEVLEGAELSKVTLMLNGRSRQLLVEPRWSLAHVLREELGLTGTKLACDRGECGACTVLVNDVPRYACMMLAVEAEGARIETVEGRSWATRSRHSPRRTRSSAGTAPVGRSWPWKACSDPIPLLR